MTTDYRPLACFGKSEKGSLCYIDEGGRVMKTSSNRFSKNIPFNSHVESFSRTVDGVIGYNHAGVIFPDRFLIFRDVVGVDCNDRYTLLVTFEESIYLTGINRSDITANDFQEVARGHKAALVKYDDKDYFLVLDQSLKLYSINEDLSLQEVSDFDKTLAFDVKKSSPFVQISTLTNSSVNLYTFLGLADSDNPDSNNLNNGVKTTIGDFVFQLVSVKLKSLNKPIEEPSLFPKIFIASQNNVFFSAGKSGFYQLISSSVHRSKDQIKHFETKERLIFALKHGLINYLVVSDNKNCKIITIENGEINSPNRINMFGVINYHQLF